MSLAAEGRVEPLADSARAYGGGSMRTGSAAAFALALLGAATGTAAQHADTSSATEALLSGMLTEEVEPGVFRVVDDGVRDLAMLRGTWGQHGGVTTGADGTVWIHTASGRYHRVGEEPARRLPQEFRRVGDSPPSTFGADALHAGPAGQLWALDAQHGRVNAWLHDEWLERADLTVDHMAVDDANHAWGAGRRGLLHVDAEGEELTAWPDDPTREVATYTLDVSADGTAYVLAGSAAADVESGFLDTLLRYDGSRWTETALPSPISVFFPGDEVTDEQPVINNLFLSLFGIFPISFHHMPTGDGQFPDLAVCQFLLCCRVDHAYTGVRNGPADVFFADIQR